MRKFSILAVVAVMLAALSPTAWQSIALAQAAASGRGEGEVRRIDKAAKKITIRHGPIEGLDMAPMTMVFNVPDPALLERLKVNDKIRFTATSEGGALTLRSAEPIGSKAP